jgi:ribosomal protein S18 acetylase RimI-like enzyme
MTIEVVRANYFDKSQAQAITQLLNAYATDPMGGGKSLPDDVLKTVVNELSKLPHAFSVISYVSGQPAGLVNCFEGFSTFSCKPLINIHDVIVLKAFRGYGLSQKMLQKIEEIAIQKGCCKLTLEVLSGNVAAKSAYQRFGFSGYELDPKVGEALFWQKTL